MRRDLLAESIRKIEISGDVLSEFKPLPGGQTRFCEYSIAKYNEIVALGGNNAGKTFLGIIACAWWVIPEETIEGKTGFTINPYRRIRIPPEGTLGWISSWSDKVQQSTIQPVLDKVLGKYIKSAKKEGGAYHWIDFAGGRIEFRWQMMGVEPYKGTKLHFAMLDEPHKQAIYRECQMRLNKFKGVMWTTMTPVIDSESPLSIRDVIWLRDKVVLPWHNDPLSRPSVDVCYLDIKDNQYFDHESARERMAGMSNDEIAARESGLFILYVSGAAFNQDMIKTLKDYLTLHPEVSIPQYGHLEYDPYEKDEDLKVHFEEDKEVFPDKPEYEDGFIVKIWEHPIKATAGIKPKYYMGGDAAGGKSSRGDASVAYVKRSDTHAIVAGLHGYLDEVEFAQQLWLLGHYYCDIELSPATICVETVSYGRTTLQYLQTGLDTKYVSFPPYAYQSIYFEPTIESLRSGIYIPSESPGWYTSAYKRPYLVTAMRLSISEAYRAYQDGYITIPDKAFFEEAEKFIRDKSGVYRAAQGEADDRLFASALADMAIKQAYNIDPRFEKENLEDIKEHYYVENGIIRINSKAFGKKREQPKNARWA